MAISPALRRFILTSVPSVPYLEAALLLHRDGKVAWSAESLAGELYITPARAAELLAALAAARVIAQVEPHPPTFRFAPGDAAILAAYAELAEVYRVETVAVAHMIHDATQRSAHGFAEAFRVRKDD